jgi:hypothetical protein
VPDPDPSPTPDPDPFIPTEIIYITEYVEVSSLSSTEKTIIIIGAMSFFALAVEIGWCLCKMKKTDKVKKSL